MKFKHIIGALAIAAALVGCKKEDNPLDQKAKVEITSSDKIEFAKTADETTVTFISTRAWKLKNVPEWLAVEPMEGNASTKEQSIVVTATPNPGKGHTAEVTIYAGTASKSFTVHQVGELPGEDDGQITVAEFISKADKQNEYILVGKVSGLTNSSYKGFDLEDETGKISIAFPVNFADWYEKMSNGGTAKVKGKYAFYEAKQTHQMENGTILEFTAGEADHSHDNDIYYNAFDAQTAAQDSNDKWPFLDGNEAMWTAAVGTGAAGAEYSSSSCTLRSNSNSDGSYSDYSGSGKNNILFSADGYVRIGKIALSETNIKLSFGTEKYDNKNKEALFDAKELPVYISNDGKKWVAVNYTYKGTAAGRWNLAEAVLTVPSGTSSLYVHITCTQTGMYRVDDLSIAKSDAAGTTVDFSTGTEIGGGSTDPVEMTVDQAIAAKTGKAIVTGRVIAVATSGFVINDGTQNNLYVPKVDSGKAVGDIVKVTSTLNNYGTCIRLGDAGKQGDILVEASTATVAATPDQTITTVDPAQAASYDSKGSAARVSVTGTLTSETKEEDGKMVTYFNLDFAGVTSPRGSVYSSNDLSALVGQRVTVKGYFAGKTTSWFMVVATEIIPDSSSYFAVSTTALSAGSAAGSVKFNVSANVDWTATADSGVTVSPASGNASAEVTVTYPENTAAQERSFKITVATTADVATKSYEINLTQSGHIDIGNASFVKVTSAPTDWSGDYLFVCEEIKTAVNGALSVDTNGIGKIGNYITVQINDGTIAVTEDLLKSKVTLAPCNDGYSIKAASGAYFQEAAKGTNKDGSVKINAGLVSSTTAVPCYIEVVSGTNGKVNIFSPSKDTVFLVNRSSKTETDPAKMYFRFYNKSNLTSNDGNISEQYYRIALYKYTNN